MLQEFSVNFVKVVELFNFVDNFIFKWFDNFVCVIDYIDDNKQLLQVEFGQGDVVKLIGEVVWVLVSYKVMYGFVV